jgi:excisionase family DNA binding protein
MYKNSKPFLSVQEAADFLNLSKASIYRLVHTDKIKCYKPGGKVLYFAKEALEDYIMG